VNPNVAPNNLINSAPIVASKILSDSSSTAAIKSSFTFNNGAVDFANVNKLPLDLHAFAGVDRYGKQRSNNAERQAQSRAARHIVEAIKSESQQALGLHLALVHPDLKGISKSAGFESSVATKTIMYQWKQLQDLLKASMSTTKVRGRTNDDKAAFIEAILTAVAPDLLSDSKDAPSLRSQSKTLGISPATGFRKLSAASKKRKALKSSNPSTSWSKITRRRKGKTNITPSVREAVCKWVRNHENVIHSPLKDDTLLLKWSLGSSTTKQRVGKLLLEISVRELHNCMVATTSGGLPESRGMHGNVIISDTSLRKIIAEDIPELRPSSARYKQMCGCEICLSISALQRSLNAFRMRKIRNLEQNAKSLRQESPERKVACTVTEEYKVFVQAPNGAIKHEKPRQAVKSIMCEQANCGHHHWNCVLRRCESCPQYPNHPLEELDEKIRFHDYVAFTKCSVHGNLEINAKFCGQCEEQGLEGKNKGKVATRKHLT
jgi:hypothetical protein